MPIPRRSRRLRSTIHGRLGVIPSAARRAFTVTELIVVAALIVILLGLLLPALRGALSTGAMAKSMNNMRQIGLWLDEYAGSHNDTIVPSRFNYEDEPYAGKARSHPRPQLGSPHSGTWSDILTAEFEVAVYPEAAAASGPERPGGPGGPGSGGSAGAAGNDYRYDSPDQWLYDTLGESAIANPFRSAAKNSRRFGDCQSTTPPFNPPSPWSHGATAEMGYPGYFAANDYFIHSWASEPTGRYHSFGQIRFPDQSVYLVDSFYGEIIEDAPPAFDNLTTNADGCKTQIEVDFRYMNGEACLMLYLDGHVDPQLVWEDLADLESRRVRICDLDQRTASCLP